MRTTIPSPPPVTFSCALITIANWATWKSSTVIGRGIRNSRIITDTRRKRSELHSQLRNSRGIHTHFQQKRSIRIQFNSTLDASQPRYLRHNSLHARHVRRRAKSRVHHILQISRVEQLSPVFSYDLRSKTGVTTTSTISFTLPIDSVDAKNECISVCVFSAAVNSISLASLSIMIPTCAGSAIQTRTHCVNRRSARRPLAAALRTSSRPCRAA